MHAEFIPLISDRLLEMFSLLKRKSNRIAIISTRAGTNSSPLDPFRGDTNGRKWTYYHLCLSEWGEVKYFEPGAWRKVQGFQYVFVHEALYDALDSATVDALEFLKQRNQKIIWVELHEKSVFSGACFLPGFFETTDLVLKHQLVDTVFLKSELEQPVNRLAPHFIYGKSSYMEYLRDPQLFDFRIPSQLVEDHLQFDFGAVSERIKALMYPFSWSLVAKGVPRYSGNNDKSLTAGYAGRLNLNHAQRVCLVAYLAAKGIPASCVDDYLTALRASRFFFALGHIHSSLRTFDTLAFDTVLIHYEPGPYKWWDEFKADKNYIPMGDVSKIFLPGGFGIDEEYMGRVIERLRIDIADDRLRGLVLEGQRALFAQLIDSRFIRAKLGIET